MPKETSVHTTSIISRPTAPTEKNALGVFNFETKTVLLNSGYSMPIVGLGTYSLSDTVCANSVSEHLKAGGRLIDTAFIYTTKGALGKGSDSLEFPEKMSSSSPSCIRANLPMPKRPLIKP